MKLHNLTITQNNGWNRVSVTVESQAITETELWFSIPSEFKDRICVDRYDPFVVGLLFPAMANGEDICVVGDVSSSLLQQLNQYAMALVCSFSSITKPIKVSANSVSHVKPMSQGVGSGFSGGVDSFLTFYTNHVCQEDPLFKINTLLFFNVGSHGPGNTPEMLERSKKKFLARYNHLKAFPYDIGLDFIPLDSNLHAFHPWGHQLTHTLTSAAAALIFQKTINKYYYSSSGISYHDLFQVSTNYRNIDIGAYCDAVLLPLLSTDSMQLIADGFQYNRMEKMIEIKDYPPVKRYLNVCVNSNKSTEINCSVCTKCCRTLVMIEAAGRLEEYSSLFDIEAYRKVRSKYLADQIVKQKDDPIARYVLDYCRQSGLSLPSPLVVVPVWLKYMLRAAYRKLIKGD